MMKKQLLISVWMTIATTILFGLIYPLAVTGIAQVAFPRQANGNLVAGRDGRITGSTLLGQTFVSPRYFHSRPSAAGPAGYDPSASTGSNLAPTNKQLIERVAASVQALHAENPGVAIPVDLVTASGSGLDPEISPAAADFQVPRVAKARGLSENAIRELVQRHTRGRQWGFLGEPRVNVLELNLDLDKQAVRR